MESRELLFTKCVLNKQIYRAQSMNALKNNIESVEVPFQEAFEKYALSEKLYQIKKMRERYIKLMRKSKKANQCIDDAWNLYLMTHDIVGLKRYYDKEHILELKEALYGQNYKFYETAITPYRENKAYWTSMGVPFLEIPELEEILLLEKKYL